MTVNKAALAEEIAARVGVTKKEAEDMLAAFVDITIESLKRGDRVTIAGFGQFSAKTRAGRIGVNPQNPSEKIPIPPVTVAKFKAGLALKTALKTTDNPSDTTPTQTSW
jgi:DNA-binding protein HU-beta